MASVKRRCPYCKSKTRYSYEEYVNHYRNNHAKIPKGKEFFAKFRKPKTKRRGRR